jgi:mRNA interferase RelE/StbE
MTYQLIILPKAEKELKKLPKKDFIRIDEIILGLASNPRPVGCKKLQGHADTYRIRSGDYRIVYNIEDDHLIVQVIRIANRKDVYGKLTL